MRSNIDFDELWEGYHSPLLDDDYSGRLAHALKRVQRMEITV